MYAQFERKLFDINYVCKSEFGGGSVTQTSFHSDLTHMILQMYGTGVALNVL
jgi:hypothetical protein